MNYQRASVSERRTLPPAVAVSTVAFALRPPAGARRGDAAAVSGTVGFGAGEDGESAGVVTLWMPLVRRVRAPFNGQWALPGGDILWNETLVDTALRALRASVGIDPDYLEQLYSFGAVERSAEAQRLVTIAYWALYGEQQLAHPKGASITDVLGADDNVAWFSADALPPLAFDHADIARHALDRLRSKTEYSTVAYHFLGDRFTLAQLREVHEAILGRTVDPANFRRQVLAQGHLIDTGEQRGGGRHRPARLYRFRAAETNEQRSSA